MTSSSDNSSDYSSRNRWLGPTPQILFWNLPGPCPPLDQFANYYRTPTGAAKTLQTLRPLKEWSRAISENRVFDDYAILKSQEFQLGGRRLHDLGFSISENMAAFGGPEFVRSSCNDCERNLSNDNNPSNEKGGIAGCCGMLPSTSTLHMHKWTNRLQGHPFPLNAPSWDHEGWSQTDEAPFEEGVRIENMIDQIPIGESEGRLKKESTWYWLLAQKEVSPEVSGNLSEGITKHINNLSTAEREKSRHTIAELEAFSAACELSSRNNRELQIQAHPAGFSDGNDWWIGPHCGRCYSSMGSLQDGCQQCGKEGGPVPIKKRRIMGWAPYWPLHTILAPSTIEKICGE